MTGPHVKLLASAYLFGASCLFARAQNPDETGTLMMAARTGAAVYLAVDSKITLADPDSIDERGGSKKFDADRKLIEVGKNGACVLDAYAGQTTLGLDVATDLRQWVRQHPGIEVPEAIGDLAKIAGANWNRFVELSYPIRPWRRKGNIITQVTCGAWVNGTAVLIRRSTYVGDNETLSAKVSVRDVETDSGATLLVGGAVSTESFRQSVLDGRVGRLPEQTPLDEREAIARITQDLKAFFDQNEESRAAFVAWQQSVPQPRSDVADRGGHSRDPDSWNGRAAQAIFVPLFRIVEANTSLVARPNNLVALTPCGRFRTEVEKKWPTCLQQKAAEKAP